MSASIMTAEENDQRNDGKTESVKKKVKGRKEAEWIKINQRKQNSTVIESSTQLKSIFMI